MLGKLGQIAIPSGDQKTIQLSSEYDETKKLRKAAAKDRELKQSDGPTATPECFGKSYFYDFQSTNDKKCHRSCKFWRRYQFGKKNLKMAWSNENRKKRFK